MENHPIRFKTPMLQSNVCDYRDAHIFAKGDISVTGASNRGKHNRFCRN